MTQPIHRRCLDASKHLAPLLAALVATGCVSNGSSQSGVTSPGGPNSAGASAGAGSSVSTSQPAPSTSNSSTPPTTSTSSSPPPPTSTAPPPSLSPSNKSLLLNYSTGFANATTALRTAFSAQFNGSVVALSSATYGAHQAGALWSKTVQNVQSFTTDFTFQLDPSAFGFTFCIQDSNSTTNPLAFGDNATADANMLGYGAYNLSGQYPIRNSVAIKFDLTDSNGQAYLGATPSGTGLYIDGGPYGGTGFVPENDLNPSGINLHSGDVMQVHIVYDGSVLTMTLLDTRTNAQARMSWPVDIPAIIGSDSGWVGFTAGTIPAVSQNLLSWSYWEGYSQELSAPTFSVPAGQYSPSQSVALSGPSGATIYYTTNGQEPTTSSTKYTGPININSSTLVQAVAVEDGYTDSPVASAYYEIALNGSPTINFASGFSSASNLVMVTGSAEINGSNIQLTDTAHNSESGAAWFATPVNVQNFTTNFNVTLTGPASANGFTFTIQNQTPPAADTSSNVVSGGPTAVSMAANGLGCEGLGSSVSVAFDLYDGSGDLVGLYQDGAAPIGSSVDMSSSGINLHSGDPLAVTLAYDGVTLTITVRDTKTNASFSKSWTIDIPTTVGGNTAYVGFTGATGGLTALQDISSWTYSN